VIVDDYSRFTWTLFIAIKDSAYLAFKKFAKVIQNEKGCRISTIKSDHEGEFQNERFDKFCEKHGIKHNFYAPRTPQQNRVVEMKNRSLEELARTLLNATDLPKYLWADAVSTTCYVLNRVLIWPILKKTPYELFKGRKPNISHLKVFGYKCFILNNGKNNLGKFDAKADEGIFLGYSLHSHAYRVYNKRTMVVEESMHVAFDETDHKVQESIKITADDDESVIQKIVTDQLGKSVEDNQSDEAQSIEPQRIESGTGAAATSTELPREWRVSRNLSLDNIIGQVQRGVSTRRSMNHFCEHTAFLSQIEPKTMGEALEDNNWINAMHEELN